MSGAPREVRRRGAGGAGVVGVGWAALRVSAAGVRWIGAASPAKGLVWGCGAGVEVAAGGVGAVGCGTWECDEAGGALGVVPGTATRWALGVVGSVAWAAEVRAGEGELAGRGVLTGGACRTGVPDAGGAWDVTDSGEAGVAVRVPTSAEGVCRAGVPAAGGAGAVTGVAEVLADPVEAAARCTGAESDAGEGPTGPGRTALGLDDGPTTGRAGSMPRATAGVVDGPAGAEPGLGGTATGRTGAAVGPTGSAALCTVAAERPAAVAADPGETELDGAATGRTGTAVDLAEATDLCTAAEAPTDAAPEPGEAAVGRTGEASATVEVTSGPAGSAPESTEVETPADTGTGTAAGTSGAPAPVPPPELPAAFVLATGRLRRCTTGAPETLVSGTAPATDEDTAAEETPEPDAPAPAPAPAEEAPPATGTAPAAARRWTTGTARATGR
ncbi:hypothetical protein OG787_35695 [Streptomyces sp. NBC_00075]|uniref:hypothetical protein n=1 Tax=Streptomyces sp. NBC_00075 TaxID=2975641 RepID=UPI00324F4A65